MTRKVLAESILDAARPGWRNRRAQRKSPWNLLQLVVWVPLLALLLWCLFMAAWHLHTLFYPKHIGHFKEFWGSGVSGRAFISSFLLVMPLFVPAITLSLFISNLLMWLIPPARRAMNAEAAGDPEMTFRGANLGLIKFGGIASAVAFVLTLIGALTLSSLR
jgi:hypothetical protein